MHFAVVCDDADQKPPARHQFDVVDHRACLRIRPSQDSSRHRLKCMLRGESMEESSVKSWRGRNNVFHLLCGHPIDRESSNAYGVFPTEAAKKFDPNSTFAGSRVHSFGTLKGSKKGLRGNLISGRACGKTIETAHLTKYEDVKGTKFQEYAEESVLR